MTRRFLFVSILLLALPLIAADHLELAGERIVFLGDSITDGNSYPLMVRQALRDAKYPQAIFINAGIGGDTALGMSKRLERDVFVHAPTLMTLSAGINDVLHKVSAKDYEASVTSIVEQLKAKNIPILILTTSVLSPTKGDADARLADYNNFLREVAKKNGYRLADVNDAMSKARAAGENVLEEDGVHPNYAGHRIMARAVLDALGYADVALPKEFSFEIMPGVIRKWQLRKMADKSPELDAAAAAAIQPDDSWTTIRLPEKEPQSHWWMDQERQRGFVVSLEKTLGKAQVYQGYATLGFPKAKSAYLNTGAQLRSVWLNGERVYKAEAEYKGWHAGRERIPIKLNSGTNTIVIESGAQFFLSITEVNKW